MAPGERSKQHEIKLTRAMAHRVGDDFVTGKISKMTLISQKLINTMTLAARVGELIPIARGRANPKRPGNRGLVRAQPGSSYWRSTCFPSISRFTLYSAMLETNAAVLCGAAGRDEQCDRQCQETDRRAYARDEQSAPGRDHQGDLWRSSAARKPRRIEPTKRNPRVHK